MRMNSGRGHDLHQNALTQKNFDVAFLWHSLRHIPVQRPGQRCSCHVVNGKLVVIVVDRVCQVHQQQQQISLKEKEVRHLVKQAKKHTKQWTSTADTVAGTLKEYGDIQNYLEVLDAETAGLLADLEHLAKLRHSRRHRQQQQQNQQQPSQHSQPPAQQSATRGPETVAEAREGPAQEVVSPSAASWTSLNPESEGSGEGLPVSSAAQFNEDGG